MRRLASIQKIKEVIKHPNADSLDIITILGWKCIVGKDEYKQGDLVVYCEVDSVLPEKPEFEFLRERCFVDNGIVRGFRIKTIKLRKEYSQGLILPLSILNGKKYSKDTRENPVYDLTESKDVTELLEINKFEKPIPLCLQGQVKGNFPGFLSKTDECRVQLLQKLLTEYKGTKCYVSEKIDGSSVTFFLNNNEFGVCSRNLELYPDNPSYHESPKYIKRTDGKYQVVDEKGELIGEILDEPPKAPVISENVYWKIARDYDIENRLRRYGQNIAIQGEIYGNGLQGNPLKIGDVRLGVFNIFLIDQSKYVSLEEMRKIISSFNADSKNQLKIVPILTEEFILNDNIDELVKYSIGNSVVNPKCKREGIVIRPVDLIENTNYSEDCVRSRISFKVISPEYLLSEE